SVVGDPHQEHIAFGFYPFVRRRVLAIIRLIHVDLVYVAGLSEPAAVPLRTKGICTTSAGIRLPRTSTCTVSPTATPRGTRAMAMETPRVGDMVPEVTTPCPKAVWTAAPERMTPRSSSRRPTKPCALSAACS